MQNTKNRRYSEIDILFLAVFAVIAVSALTRCVVEFAPLIRSAIKTLSHSPERQRRTLGIAHETRSETVPRVAGDIPPLPRTGASGRESLAPLG